MTKTLLFVVGAVAAVSGAILGRPGRVGVEVPDQVGHPLFADFTDPALAENLKVAEYDDLTGKVKEFEVAKKQGVWVIPSHENYAADAMENLKVAATMFIDTKVLNVASDQNKDHATFGVLEPSAERIREGTDGIGKMVTLKDAKGNRLVELIIGKVVKDAEDQRFVRVPKQDRVYIVEIDSSQLSTKFSDWVEQDVLQLDAMDIQRMIIRDYSVTPVMTGDGRMLPQLEDRSLIDVRWNADDFKWDLEELQEFVAGVEGQPGELRPTQLMQNEELDKKRLDNMKNALADLKIADVSIKPPGLREGLKEATEAIWNDREGFQSLLSRGFYPRPLEGGGLGIASTEGEVTMITKEGVDYTLRFGQIASANEGDANQLNRFVMITAAVDEASIPQPELEEMPPEPAGPESDAEGDESKDVTSEADDQSESGDEAASDDPPESEEDVEEPAGEDPAEAERDRIAKENQRKLDEYNDKRKIAQDKVDKLNLRFSDWYYVVAEEVYKDIHLSRLDVIEVKESTAEEGTGVDAFRKLLKEGLKREDQDE